jgi:hypothetical protein
MDELDARIQALKPEDMLDTAKKSSKNARKGLGRAFGHFPSAVMTLSARWTRAYIADSEVRLLSGSIRNRGSVCLRRCLGGTGCGFGQCLSLTPRRLGRLFGSRSERLD